MKKQTRRTPKPKFEKKFRPLRDVQIFLVDNLHFNKMIEGLAEPVAEHVAAQFPALKTKTEDELSEEFENGLWRDLLDTAGSLIDAMKADIESQVLVTKTRTLSSACHKALKKASAKVAS